LKIKVNVDKTTVFVGEPVVATFKIYMHPQLNILQLSPDKVPQLNGFWNQEFNLGEIRYGLEQADGTTYRTATIKKVILFPQQSGQLNVDSYDFKALVRLQVRVKADKEAETRSRAFSMIFLMIHFSVAEQRF